MSFGRSKRISTSTL